MTVLVSDELAPDILRLLIEGLTMIAICDPSNPSYEEQPCHSRDIDYQFRNAAVYSAVGLALQLGWSAGIRMDEDSPQWPVAYIVLPTGQVSWHLPRFPHTYDLHSVVDKYARIAELARLAA
jgi:hypothetical protein